MGEPMPKSWTKEFVKQLVAKYGHEGIVKVIGSTCEATGMVEDNPMTVFFVSSLLAKPQAEAASLPFPASKAASASVATATTTAESAKRPRVSYDDGTAPAKPVLTEEKAQAIVKQKTDAGKWVIVKCDSQRNNTGQYADRPARVFVGDFIIDGTERTTFDFKDTIKAAGYTHYSGNDKAGWVPFNLPGGKKGQGKFITDSATLEECWEIKEFNTAKPHESGTGVVWRGKHYPEGDQFGPRGQNGGSWANPSFTGD